MSDAAREWRFYLDDMVAFAGKVMAYTADLDQAGFVASELIYDATLRNLELIGEAATHIPGEVAQPAVVIVLVSSRPLPLGSLGAGVDGVLSHHRPPARHYCARAVFRIAAG